ncbi:MAG: hypothetical protein J0L79_02645 [Rickettsiales bacterium]|nr:hypothetical protein [Rickettsiales bacterium]MCA0254478.1 heavy-metal-associated domain-containing protein [Pseudomonadota bacterium]
MEHSHNHHNHKNHLHDNTNTQRFFENFITYKPLIVVVIFCIILSTIESNHFTAEKLMYNFMGYFFIFLSLFKFFDLKGFVEGFATYDLITARIRWYGYFYPFIEFSLGAAYLMQFNIVVVNILTLIVMSASGISVLKSILSGQKIKCACLGSVLNVPLSTVSVLENFGMGAMAAYKLIVF